METLYRKVAVSDRLPEKESFNFIKYTCGSTDSAFFSIKENKFYARRKDIEWWLEEIPEAIKSDNTETLANALQQIEKLEAEKTELLKMLEKCKTVFKSAYVHILVKDVENIIQKLKND